MAVKRSVTKSKKDGVKKKTVTYSTKRGSVTKSKTKGKTGKSKTTTVTVKKRTHAGTKDKMVASSSKTKGNRKATVKSNGQTFRAKGTQKQKDVLMSDGRMVTATKRKGADYGRATSRSIGGVAGKRFAQMDKTKALGKYKASSSGKSVGTMSGVKKRYDHRATGTSTTKRRGRSKRY